ncbi:MAG: AraC family transcriptional regulator [Chelatococcus sp.]|nr:MAG: AraC family transcriptional regulator [Chelatococcus sp.]
MLTETPPRDTLGCSLSHLAQDRELFGGGMSIYRKVSRHSGVSRVETPPSDRGILVGVSLGPGHRRRIYRHLHALDCDFGRDSIYVRRFDEVYRADMETPFDFLLMEIGFDALDRAPRDEATGRADGIGDIQGGQDVILAHLAQALLPALERPQEACPLFVDQLALTIQTHLMCRYGGMRPAPPPRNRKLSRAQETLAKDMLCASLNGDILIGDIATACLLSRSHFIRAFRETTGSTPYQWLLTQRIRRARELLQVSALPLSDIAADCGFADQSHFTRVFSRMVGAPPAAWRRQQ